MGGWVGGVCVGEGGVVGGKTFGFTVHCNTILRTDQRSCICIGNQKGDHGNKLGVVAARTPAGPPSASWFTMKYVFIDLVNAGVGD